MQKDRKSPHLCIFPLRRGATGLRMCGISGRAPSSAVVFLLPLLGRWGSWLDFGRSQENRWDTTNQAFSTPLAFSTKIVEESYNGCLPVRILRRLIDRCSRSGRPRILSRLDNSAQLWTTPTPPRLESGCELISSDPHERFIYSSNWSSYNLVQNFYGKASNLTVHEYVKETAKRSYIINCLS